jgi:hypothetical protein
LKSFSPNHSLIPENEDDVFVGDYDYEIGKYYFIISYQTQTMSKNHQKSLKRESQNQSQNMIYLQMLYQFLQRMYNLLSIMTDNQDLSVLPPTTSNTS